MAIYNPPKTNVNGAIASGVGDTLMAGAGLAAAIPGVGWGVAAALTAVGGITKLIGASSTAKQERLTNEYNQKYDTIVQGEQNSQINYFNNLQASKSNYNINGINSSIKNINAMIEPTVPQVPQGGGTGIINNRLT